MRSNRRAAVPEHGYRPHAHPERAQQARGRLAGEGGCIYRALVDQSAANWGRTISDNGLVGRHRAEAPFRLLFVCTGNICRSPFAEIITRH